MLSTTLEERARTCACVGAGPECDGCDVVSGDKFLFGTVNFLFMTIVAETRKRCGWLFGILCYRGS